MADAIIINQLKDTLGKHAPQRREAGQLMLAAVLVPIYEKDGKHHVLLTVRTNKVEHHKGQISFPGGGRDPDDNDLVFTALRETHEEIGVHPDHVEIIGQLDDTPTISNFLVTPYVGRITHSPYPFAPFAEEVAEILEVPIDHLLDPANFRWDHRKRPDGGEVIMPSYLFGEHLIFGATARMLHQFLELAGPSFR